MAQMFRSGIDAAARGMRGGFVEWLERRFSEALNTFNV